MGQLVNGIWQDVWYDTSSTQGRFKRMPSQFRNWVTADGQPGPTGAGGFKAEPGRYHLTFPSPALGLTVRLSCAS